MVYHWDKSHSISREKLKTEIIEIIVNSHFDIKEKSILKTDASHNGLECILEQFQRQKGKLLRLLLGFLNGHENEYSTNKLERLGVVCASEHFKNYLYGTDFKKLTYHMASLSALSANHCNKTMHSRLTSWVIRNLCFVLKTLALQVKIWALLTFYLDFLQSKPCLHLITTKTMS